MYRFGEKVHSVNEHIDIYKGTQLLNDKEVVIKQIKKKWFAHRWPGRNEDKFKMMTYLVSSDLNVLQVISHPNLVQVSELLQDTSNAYIISEYSEGSNL